MNFKKGDKVICISTDGGYERYLTIGKPYDVERIDIGKITKLEHIYVSSDVKIPRIVSPLSQNFLTINDFKLKQRKDKLNRLNLV